MSSINTNASAMTALQTLNATNKNLSTVQSRISTGQRVSQASDNAAYWSIATTMRSDNKAMSTVQDALGLGAAQVDIAYTAMDSVKDTLDEIKTKLVAAQQPDVDKAKIQTEIEQLKNDLKTYAASATFSGGNWLDVKSGDVQKVVASFIRSAAGGVSLGTIDVDTSKIALFSDEAGGGLLQQGDHNSSLGGMAVGAATAGATTGSVNADIALGTMTYADAKMYADDTISFDMTYMGETKTVTIKGPASATDAAAAFDDTTFAAALNTALDEAWGAGKFTGAASSGAVTIEADAVDDGESIAIENLAANAAKINVTEIDITEASAAELSALSTPCR